MKRTFSISWILVGLFLVFFGMPWQAAAGQFHISGSFSYNSSKFGNSNFQWSRRLGASVGYSFWLGLSEVEFSVQDVLYRTVINNSEDTTFHDQIYSVDWVQSFTSKNFPVQPYIKFGFGQLNREATGSYSGGATPPAVFDSLTGILGGGLKIFILRSFALRGEASTYLAGGVISTWQDNLSFNMGFSFYL